MKEVKVGVDDDNVAAAVFSNDRWSVATGWSQPRSSLSHGTKTVDNENVDFQLLSHWLFELNKYDIARVTCANGHAEKMTGQTTAARKIEYSTIVRKPAGLAHLSVQDVAMDVAKEKLANHAQFDKTTYDEVLKESTKAIRHLEEKEQIISVGNKHHAMMIYTRKIGDKNHQKGKLEHTNALLKEATPNCKMTGGFENLTCFFQFP